MEATAPSSAIDAPEIHTKQPSNANMRTARDFSKARRHSYLVTAFKFGLPTLACVIVIIFASSAFLSYSPLADVSIDSAGLKDGKLVMESPKMAGFDKNNRPYDVKAELAIQDLTNPDIIELVTIDARLPMDAKTFADLDAKSGTYDSVKEHLKLFDNVTIKGARGMDIFLQDADIDIKTGSMKSDKPVKVVSDDTNISADSVKVEQNGKRIVFKKRVKMTIKRPVRRGTSQQNDQAKAKP